MELLAYFLAFFGLVVMIKGAKPTILWINKITDKELLKGVGFITVILTLCFYAISMFSYLKNF